MSPRLSFPQKIGPDDLSRSWAILWLDDMQPDQKCCHAHVLCLTLSYSWVACLLLYHRRQTAASAEMLLAPRWSLLCSTVVRHIWIAGCSSGLPSTKEPWIYRISKWWAPIMINFDWFWSVWYTRKGWENWIYSALGRCSLGISYQIL